MVTTTNSKKSVIRCATLVLTILLSLAITSNCYAADYALLLQQSPVEGGSVEPGTGVHRVGDNSQVTLRAVPQPGYQFVTWLGDVDEPTAPVTNAFMDSPKIIIAVFERIQYESIANADLLFSGPGGGSGLRRSAADISSGSGSGAIRRTRPKSGYLQLPDEEEPDDFPVADTEDDFPVPGDDTQTPEPSTILLMTGAAMLTRFRRKK
jgi:hypothetical protein